MKKTLGNKTAGEQVANVLRQKILSGEIPDKTELTQKWIANQLGVSRIPIREALHQLEFECLIERLDNRHTRVLGVNEKTMVPRFRFIAALESEAAIYVALQKDNSVNIRKLKDCASAKPTPENELLFHANLFKMSGDRFINQLYLRMGAPVLEVLLKTRQTFADDTSSQLLKIVYEIEKGNEFCIRHAVESYYQALQLEMRFET